jgi:hypothetical protein
MITAIAADTLSGLLSPAQASRRLGLSPARVKQMIQRGELPGP